MKVVYGRKSFDVDVIRVSSFGKILGLMFKSRETGNLLFEFRKSKKREIHSYFVFFPFLALWLDENNKVVDWIIVRPFTSAISPKRKFRKLIEVPMNTDNEHIFRFFVGGKKDLNIT